MTAPASIRDITADWLREVVPGAASLTRVETQRIGETFGFASEVARCVLVGVPALRSVVVKVWPTDGLVGAREVDFYRTFGARAGIRVPVCHHAALDPASRRGVLVLEDLEGSVQGDCLDTSPRAEALALASALAGLHATWWEGAEIFAAACLPPAPRATRDAEWVASRREVVLRRFGDRLDARTRAMVDRIEVVQARADERLADAPVTLVHGDLHLDNVLFEEGTGRPVILDWSQVARGAASLDVVELLFAIARPEDRDAVLAGYLMELGARGVHVDPARLHRAIGGALLRQFSRATFGVALWEPRLPREARIIDITVARVLDAVRDWSERDPTLVAV